ncbi:uncharacterized protein LOC142224124 [Haematobia irritans]|uniref:uncharacterized protein LOC142224124 n=1 Tax=Haematobia irritans TaxID=7368 RepID=UPI003F4FC532
MIEVKPEETEPSPEDKKENDIEPTPEEKTVNETEPTPENIVSESKANEEPEDQTKQNIEDELNTLNPLNEPDCQTETEAKGKNRRYWTPKEEDKFFLIWGRDNWRLTKHGKNTIFFAKWSEEMKTRFDIDVKPEEVQCKVNQTRAKYRQVKRLVETNGTAITWKKYDLVEKILKNQYRSKDDEPVPQEALENNRDLSPTELLNNPGAPASPTNVSNSEQSITLNQSTGDHQLAEDVSLSEQNLTANILHNNSQSNNSFSTELFGLDQMEIKQEFEAELKREGFSEFAPIVPNEHGNSGETVAPVLDNQLGLIQNVVTQQPQEETQNTVPNSQVPSDIINNINQWENPQHIIGLNSDIAQQMNQNHMPLMAITNNNGPESMAVAEVNHVNNNHVETKVSPPRRRSSTTTTPRKRNRTPSGAGNAKRPPPPPASTTVATTASKTTAKAATKAPLTQDSLETMYLEEMKKKNVILVEQGEISRKRLRLEERKVKLMEDFFPKFLKIQQDILQKLDNVTNITTPEAINIRIEE